ncbi:hypothetical protein ACHAWT_003770 [Skeletonema menzelii]
MTRLFTVVGFAVTSSLCPSAAFSCFSTVRHTSCNQRRCDTFTISLSKFDTESLADDERISKLRPATITDNELQQSTIGQRTLGILVLLTVPLAWGTYTPVVKYMYEKMDPSMPGFVFSAGYYIVAAVSLTVLSQLQAKNVDQEVLNAPNNLQIEEENNKITTRGGWELGSYLFIGNGLQVVGLQTVPADRAAFLVQLTTVIVPLLSAFAAGNLSAIPLQTWAACIIAFSGVVIMGADGNIAYSMHVVRLGEYAPRTTAIKLAASKATTEAFLSIALVAALVFVGSSAQSSLPEFVNKIGHEVVDYYNAISSAVMNGSVLGSDTSIGASAAAILWTGWITCAYTIFAQSFGQSRVNPTDSNLIYTTQPLFSSLFAYVLLGELLGVYGYIGAALIGIALWLVSSSGDESL